MLASYIMHYLCEIYFDADKRAIVYSFVFFMVGGMVFIYKEEIEKVSSMKWISIILLVISSGIYFFVTDMTVVMLLIGVCVLIMSLFISEKGFLINPITKFLGGISFEIYLCHMFIFRIVEKLHLLDVTDNDYINYILVFIAVFAGTIVFAYVAKIMINKTMKILIKE